MQGTLCMPRNQHANNLEYFFIIMKPRPRASYVVDLDVRSAVNSDHVCPLKDKQPRGHLRRSTIDAAGIEPAELQGILYT